MYRLTTICVLATMLALSLGYSAQAPSIGCSGARVMAQKLYDQLDQANANQDLNRVLSFVDLSYVGTDVHGKHTGFAEMRKETEEGFAVFRNINLNTTVEDVRLEGGRMVVYLKVEEHLEYHGKDGGWTPETAKGTREDTWERKGGEWKLVRSTAFRNEVYVDPQWIEEQKTIAINHHRAAQKVAESMGCPCR